MLIISDLLIRLVLIIFPPLLGIVVASDMPIKPSLMAPYLLPCPTLF